MGDKASIPPLSADNRETVDTRTAAHHLNRSPKTLRSWAYTGSGPISPKRIHGRLAWPVENLRQLLAGGAA